MLNRLTRKSLEYKDTWIADGSLNNIEGVVRGKAIDKLAEFEDFMESLVCEELEELEHLIGYPRFVDGYDEQGNEINRIDFVTYKQSFNEVFEKNKKLQQENQALKDRWQKLKEWLMYTLEEKQNSPKYYKFNNVLDKMQELEKEK